MISILPYSARLSKTLRMTERSGANPMPPPMMSKFCPSISSRGKEFPKGPRIPILSMGLSSGRAVVSPPTLLMLNSMVSGRVGEEVMDIGASPTPSTDTSANWPDLYSNFPVPSEPSIVTLKVVTSIVSGLMPWMVAIRGRYIFSLISSFPTDDIFYYSGNIYVDRAVPDAPTTTDTGQLGIPIMKVLQFMKETLLYPRLPVRSGVLPTSHQGEFGEHAAVPAAKPLSALIQVDISNIKAVTRRTQVGTDATSQALHADAIPVIALIERSYFIGDSADVQFLHPNQPGFPGFSELFLIPPRLHRGKKFGKPIQQGCPFLRGCLYQIAVADVAEQYIDILPRSGVYAKGRAKTGLIGIEAGQTDESRLLPFFQVITILVLPVKNHIHEAQTARITGTDAKNYLLTVCFGTWLCPEPLAVTPGKPEEGLRLREESVLGRQHRVDVVQRDLAARFHSPGGNVIVPHRRNQMVALRQFVQ